MNTVSLIASKEPGSAPAVIFVCKTISRFPEGSLLPEEMDYIAGQQLAGQTTIEVQRMKSVAIIHLCDEKLPLPAALEKARKAGFKAQQIANGRKFERLQVIGCDAEPIFTTAVIEGAALGNYQFTKYITQSDDRIHALKTIEVLSPQHSDEQIAAQGHLINSVFFARDLINEPANYLTASRLAAQIAASGQRSGFGVEIFDKTKIESLCMGGLLAVNRGSTEPPTFTVLEWKPAGHRNQKPYVLVGKGIVYDTGGLSLKPTKDAMDFMKSDMAGAALVAGVFEAVAQSGLPLWLIGLVPATDNRIDANSYSPGDVIKMHNGTTVEMLNADAEGRMILADALSFAQKYDPELVIDFASLTGAAAAAIGKEGAVVMGTAPEDVFNMLTDSAQATYERLVRFPLWDEYAEMLKSDIADVKNVGNATAGAITAGKFLERFIRYPWVHFDIAGVAFSKEGDSYHGKGGSGWGIRLMFDYFTRLLG